MTKLCTFDEKEKPKSMTLYICSLLNLVIYGFLYQKFAGVIFSFGQDCIFLIGGPTKAIAPVPLFLHSGDISLMTGPARLSFHAVPRILQADPSYIDACFCTDQEKEMGHSPTVNGHNDTDNSLKVKENLKDCDIQSNGPDKNQTQSDIRTDHIKGNSDMVVTKSESSSDHEMEDGDPYSSSFNTNSSCKLSYQSCDNKVDNSTDQCVSVSSKGGNCELSDLKALMDRVIQETDWSPFQKYLNQSRINVNVRKVLIEGESLPHSPAVIPKCQGKKQ